MKSVEQRRDRGFTLIELMVAMTIGLLLTVTIAQIFLGSRRTYSTNDDLSRMQENMRYTHDMLNRVVRMTGYMAYPGSSPIDIDAIKGVFPGATPALAGVDGDGGSTSAVTTPDSFTVRFQGTGSDTGVADGETTDCLGNIVSPTATSTNIFTINATTKSLECDIGDGKPQVLVSDVENMQILYGEETTGDFATDKYVPRNLVANMDRVMAVRIALLFRTPNLNVRSAPDTSTYPLFAGTVPAPTGPEATRIRRTMTMTIALRNRSP
jgi:type IV pilus assembly protein PilW